MRKSIEKDTLIKILDCCIEDDCQHCPNAYKDSSIAACEAVARGSVHIPFSIMRETIKALQEKPSIDSTTWVCHLYRCGSKRFECSWCHGTSWKASDYCPDCGTRMAEVVNMDD